jgi:hypothetical protein
VQNSQQPRACNCAYSRSRLYGGHGRQSRNDQKSGWGCPNACPRTSRLLLNQASDARYPTAIPIHIDFSPHISTSPPFPISQQSPHGANCPLRHDRHENTKTLPNHVLPPIGSYSIPFHQQLFTSTRHHIPGVFYCVWIICGTFT